MTNTNLMIAAEKTKHAYDVCVRNLASGVERTLEVHANSRTQAASHVERNGFPKTTFTIMWVNMVG